MQISIDTSVYNERRYGKPWIAKIVFTSASKCDFAWGDWVGDHYNGGEGTLVLADLKPGDIIAKGQKDNRKPRNSAPDFYVVKSDGEIDHIGDKGAAYKFFMAQEEGKEVEITELEEMTEGKTLDELLQELHYQGRMGADFGGIICSAIVQKIKETKANEKQIL